MSYTIHYGKERKYIRTSSKRHYIPWLFTIVIILAITIGLFYFLESGFFQDSIISWMKPEIKAAFHNFTTSISEGDSFRETIIELYVQILEASDVRE